MHGLFAPVHKVQKIGNSTLPKSQQTPKLSKYALSAAGLSRERSGSQESISSISSSASSISRSRVRLGVTSLHTNQVHEAWLSFRPPSKPERDKNSKIYVLAVFILCLILNCYSVLS